MVQLNDDVAGWMQEAPLGTTWDVEWGGMMSYRATNAKKMNRSSFHQWKECHSGQCFWQGLFWSILEGSLGSQWRIVSIQAKSKATNFCHAWSRRLCRVFATQIPRMKRRVRMRSRELSTVTAAKDFVSIRIQDLYYCICILLGARHEWRIHMVVQWHYQGSINSQFVDLGFVISLPTVLLQTRGLQ